MDATHSMPAHDPRPSSALKLGAGITAILVGFGCFFAADLFDGGFFRGLFQGATIALMVIGVYLIGSRLWWRKAEEQALDDGAQWLPSRDSTDHLGTEDQG